MTTLRINPYQSDIIQKSTYYQSEAITYENNWFENSQIDSMLRSDVLIDKGVLVEKLDETSEELDVMMNAIAREKYTKYFNTIHPLIEENTINTDEHLFFDYFRKLENGLIGTKIIKLILTNLNDNIDILQWLSISIGKIKIHDITHINLSIIKDMLNYDDYRTNKIMFDNLKKWKRYLSILELGKIKFKDQKQQLQFNNIMGY